MRKFQVGDEVEILSFNELKEQAYANIPIGCESLYFPYCTFKLNKDMKPFCGQKTKVLEIFDEFEYSSKDAIHCCRLEIDGGEWTWLERWLR